MTWYEVVSIVAAAFAFPAGALAIVLWFLLRGVISEMAALKEARHEHEVFCLNTFAKDVDVKEFMRGIRGSLDAIQSGLAANTNITTGLSVQITALTEKINSKN